MLEYKYYTIIFHAIESLIFKDKVDNLIRIYELVCDYFNIVQYYRERFSNNKHLKFTDQEVMTIYLYGVHYQEYSKIKHIHKFAFDYLVCWFSKISSYKAFNNRLNRLRGAFAKLSEKIISLRVAASIKVYWIPSQSSHVQESEKVVF